MDLSILGSPYPLDAITLTEESVKPVSSLILFYKSKALPASGCLTAPPKLTQLK